MNEEPVIPPPHEQAMPPDQGKAVLTPSERGPGAP